MLATRWYRNGNGMEKNLLMLAEGDFLAPIDYRDLLHRYVTAAEAERMLAAG